MNLERFALLGCCENGSFGSLCPSRPIWISNLALLHERLNVNLETTSVLMAPAGMGCSYFSLYRGKWGNISVYGGWGIPEAGTLRFLGGNFSRVHDLAPGYISKLGGSQSRVVVQLFTESRCLSRKATRRWRTAASSRWKSHWWVTNSLLDMLHSVLV